MQRMLKNDTIRLSVAIAGTIVATTTAAAQSAPAAGSKGLDLPPIRQLGAVSATAKENLGSVAAIRPLSDGRVLVNELSGRRVLLFDAALQSFTVVADSTPATNNAYGGRIAGLVGWRGDSTLFVDPQSLSMLVLDPAGKVARVMSVPSAQDAMAFAGVLGSTSVDPQGRLVYRASPRFEMRAMGPGAAGGPPRMPEMPDSAPIFRIDLATRKVDTVAYIKTQKIKMNTTQDENGRIMMTSEINPLPVVDEWALTSDGSVALVRGRDYHVDWVSPTGERTSSPKVPFEWQRLSDEDKSAFIDSVKAARERMGANAPTVMGPGGGGNAAGGQPGGGEARVMIFGGPPPGGDGGRGRPGQAGPGGNVTMQPPQMKFVDPSELPDYKPVFLNGFVRADVNGNVWVRTIPTKAMAGGPVYDVINRKGELVERVQIPIGRTISAFGAGGVVYLTSREGQVTKLEKASLR
ncbi:MAG TPA: hypothetical protein VM076_13060 [Gemmatimonadaceae bacterium]|nr:hypothetical protein [Gemmatimonadaceae bacterium]